jgi:hypothetical protein
MKSKDPRYGCVLRSGEDLFCHGSAILQNSRKNRAVLKKLGGPRKLPTQVGSFDFAQDDSSTNFGDTGPQTSFCDQLRSACPLLGSVQSSGSVLMPETQENK